ncbi:MAG: SRPBCC domain-containing protein [Chitinophagales bacterium]
MKNIQTEIIINASAAKVWSVLTDFKSFSEWNPFIAKIEGAPSAGARLRVELKNGNSTSVFKPEVLVAETQKRFEWKGSLPIPGLFVGQHYFVIEEISAAQVKFIHGEQFSGLLAGLIMKQIGEQTMQGFIAMNKALKLRAEQA